MLEALGSVLITGTAAAVIVTIATTLSAGRGGQAAIAAGLGAWVGMLVDVTSSGAIQHLPVMLTLFAAPLLAAAIGCLTNSEFRDRLFNVPTRLIVGLNVLRSIGAMFIALAYAGALGGPFPFFAGYGDIATGVLAIPLALRAPTAFKLDTRLLLWNTLGMVDLIVAVTLGVLSAKGTPIQLIHAGAGSEAIAHLPWSLVPLFLVPCFLIGHGIVYAQIYAARSPARRAATAVSA